MSAQRGFTQDDVLILPHPCAERRITILQYHDQLLGRDTEGGGRLPFQIRPATTHGDNGDRLIENKTDRSPHSPTGKILALQRSRTYDWSSFYDKQRANSGYTISHSLPANTCTHS
jgi:hypothetical protein